MNHEEMAREILADTQVVQYLVHPMLRPVLDEWLVQQGFRVDRLPPDVEGEDSLPTYLIAPRYL